MSLLLIHILLFGQKIQEMTPSSVVMECFTESSIKTEILKLLESDKSSQREVENESHLLSQWNKMDYSISTFCSAIVNVGPRVFYSFACWLRKISGLCFSLRTIQKHSFHIPLWFFESSLCFRFHSIRIDGFSWCVRVPADGAEWQNILSQPK